MSEHKATITIEIVDNEAGNIESHVSLNGELNLIGASYAIANFKKIVAEGFEVPEYLVDAGIEAAKRTIAQKETKQDSARDKLYELLEALHAKKEAGNEDQT